MKTIRMERRYETVEFLFLMIGNPDLFFDYIDLSIFEKLDQIKLLEDETLDIETLDEASKMLREKKSYQIDCIINDIKLHYISHIDILTIKNEALPKFKEIMIDAIEKDLEFFVSQENFSENDILVKDIIIDMLSFLVGKFGLDIISITLEDILKDMDYWSKLENVAKTDFYHQEDNEDEEDW